MSNYSGVTLVSWRLKWPPTQLFIWWLVQANILLADPRDPFVNVPIQWEMTLQCNAVSHWLGTFTKWPLRYPHAFWQLTTPEQLLTHWGLLTNICFSKLNAIGSGLSPGQHQAISLTNALILFIWPLGTNFSEISIEIHTFWFKKMHLKMYFGKWWPLCPSLNVLNPQPFYRVYIEWCEIKIHIWCSLINIYLVPICAR